MEASGGDFSLSTFLKNLLNFQVKLIFQSLLTNKLFFLKAQFQSRVFIDYVVFVNRFNPLIYFRSNNTDLKTILSVNGQNVMTCFGNTGEIGERRMFSCMRQADGIYIEQPQAVSQITINLQEIWVYGAVL